MKTQGIWLIITAVCLVLLPSCSKPPQEVEEQYRDAEEKQLQYHELPEIIPYLDAKPSALDGQGHADIDPNGPFLVGSPVDFTITFTVGKAGIVPGGFVILQISPWWGWSPPQDLNPEAGGFISVSASFDHPSLQVKILPMHRVLVFSTQHAIKHGETIVFNYTRARVDRFAEAEEQFMIFVDADGDGHSACIAHPPLIKTLAREPVRLNVTAPSLAKPGQRLHISAAPLDSLGNWSLLPGGTYTLRGGSLWTHRALRRLCDWCAADLRLQVFLWGLLFQETDPPDFNRMESCKTVASDQEKKVTFTHTLRKEGIYFFYIDGPQGLTGRSNVILCQAGTPVLKLYFGDIHGHSRLSDGSGTPEDYYEYAREVSGLDMAALTDHADYGLIPFKGEVWQRIKGAANTLYSPGHFVTYVGFEWTNWTYGHRNVYYRDGDGPVFSSLDNISDTPEKLWDCLAGYEAMTIGHHVGGGPVPLDWSIPPGPKERLVEICSIHGSSEYYGCESGIYHPQEGHFVRDALNRGYRLGIIGSGDTHDGHPGQRSINAPVTGLAGVYATALTREAVWEALQKRRVYGTSGPKIILNFRVGDSPMGSEIQWQKAKGPLPIIVRAVCCENIERIDIFRSGALFFSEPGEKIDGVFAIYLIEDPEPLAGSSWYYARVIQADGNMAWSSPVWVDVSPGGSEPF